MRAAIALVALMCGCVGSTAAPSREPASVITACPLGVPDTRVRVVETKDGLDLVLTTARVSRVTELRERARDQVRANGPGRHVGRGHDGEHSGGHDHGLRLWAVEGVRATVEDLAAGARIGITAVDPARVREIREVVIKRVARLESKGCPG